MKKTVQTLFVLGLALCLLSCTTEKKKATWITEAYVKALYGGDYQTAASYASEEKREEIEMLSTMAAETQEDVDKILSSKIQTSFDSVLVNNQATEAIVYVKVKGIEGAYNYLNGQQLCINLKKVMEIDRWRVTNPKINEGEEQPAF